MTRDARGRWCSEGRVLLLAALSTTTARTLARSCRVTPAAISALAGGVCRFPSLPVALALARVAGIAPDAWLRAPATAASKSNPIDRPQAKVTKSPPRAA